MDTYMESTTFVSVNVCSTYTHVEIKQLLNDGMGIGGVRINPNGIFLTTAEFGSLMYQLKAIENEFLLSANKHQIEDSARVGDIDFKTISDTPCSTSCDTEKGTNAGSTKPKQGKRKLKQESVESKKETIRKKIKKENCSANADVIKAYAQLLPNVIDRLIKNRCFGCMLNLDVSLGGHNICTDRNVYIEQCFVEAVGLVDQVKVAELVDCENVPTKEELLVDTEWCNSVKLMLHAE